MTAVPLEVHDRLVGRIYEAALDPAGWRVFVDELSAAANGSTVGIQAYDYKRNIDLGAINTHAPEFAASYRDYYSSINVWMPAFAAMPLGSAQHVDSFCSRESLVRSEYYNDWLRPQGILTSAGIVLHRDEHRFLGLGINIDGRNEEEVTAPTLRLIDRLAPHLLRSFEIVRQLSGEGIGPMIEASLETVAAGVFLVDRYGRLTRANSLGESLLRSGRAVALGQDRRLALADARAQQQIDKVLGALASGDHSAMSANFALLANGMAGPMKGSIAPFRPASGFNPPPLFVLADDLPAAIITLSHPPAPTGLDVLSERFALSPAERRVAEALYAGSTLQRYAEERGISIHTVRNQLKSLMAKVGVTRQSHLVALFASLLSGAR